MGMLHTGKLENCMVAEFIWDPCRVLLKAFLWYFQVHCNGGCVSSKLGTLKCRKVHMRSQYCSKPAVCIVVFYIVTQCSWIISEFAIPDPQFSSYILIILYNVLGNTTWCFLQALSSAGFSYEPSYKVLPITFPTWKYHRMAFPLFSLFWGVEYDRPSLNLFAFRIIFFASCTKCNPWW